MKAFNSLEESFIKQRKNAHEICRLFAKSPSKGNLKRLRSMFAHCGEQVVIEAGFHKKAIIAQDFGPYQIDLVNAYVKPKTKKSNPEFDRNGCVAGAKAIIKETTQTA